MHLCLEWGLLVVWELSVICRGYNAHVRVRGWDIADASMLSVMPWMYKKVCMHAHSSEHQSLNGWDRTEGLGFFSTYLQIQ